MSWNCRRLGQPQAVRVLSELIQAHRPDVVILYETLVHGHKLESIRVRIKFEGFFSMDCVGHSNGIGILCKTTSQVTLLNFSQNHVNLEVVDDMYGSFRHIGFYGYPKRQRRLAFWDFLQSLAVGSNIPWCSVGDFNDMLSQDDKKDSVEHPQHLFKGFRQAIMDCSLHDVPMQGFPYTWERFKGKSNCVEERLDRIFVNDEWLAIHP